MWPPLKSTFQDVAPLKTTFPKGRDVLQRPWRVTLAGPASDPVGDRRSGTRKRSLAGDPGGDGGRPWRGATLALQDVAPTKNHMARCGPH